MKNVAIKLAFALVFTFGIGQLAFAQSPEHKHNVYLGAGFSLVGGLFDLGSNGDTVNTNSSPALQLTYDYSVSKVITIGAAFSRQSYTFAFNDYTYTDPNSGNLVTESFSGQLNRTNIAARVLFHYGNKGKLDMYSGLRLGMTNWAGNFETTDPNFDQFDSFNGWAFAPQLIPFALRYYPAANVGLSFETAVGAPHLFTTGLNYRF